MKGSDFSIRFRILEVLLGIDSNGELSSVDISFRKIVGVFI